MKSGGGPLSFFDFLDFGDKLGLGKLGMANDIGDVFKGKPMLDPILNGVITPTGQFSKRSNEWLDKKGLGDVGWFHNNVAPIIAASIFTGGAASGAFGGGAAGGGAAGSGGSSGFLGGLFGGGGGGASSGFASGNLVDPLFGGMGTGGTFTASGSGMSPGLFGGLANWFGSPSTTQNLQPLANYGQSLFNQGQQQQQPRPMGLLSYYDVQPRRRFY